MNDFHKECIIIMGIFYNIIKEKCTKTKKGFKNSLIVLKKLFRILRIWERRLLITITINQEFKLY